MVGEGGEGVCIDERGFTTVGVVDRDNGVLNANLDGDRVSEELAIGEVTSWTRLRTGRFEGDD